MRFQIAAPVRVLRRAAVGRNDHEPAVRLCETAQRGHALLTRPGADVVYRDQRDTLELAADSSLVGTELLDDRLVHVGHVAGRHGRACSPAAVRTYAGTMVVASTRDSSTSALPAISGVNSSPSCSRYVSSVCPLRAA